MPRITIREIDKSTPGLRQYSNFSVLVPGFISKSKKGSKSYFDENGVYECTNTDDFIEKIGKTVGYVHVKNGTETTARVPCKTITVTKRPMYEEADADVIAIKEKLGKPADDTKYIVYPVTGKPVKLTAKDIIWSYWFSQQLIAAGEEPVKQDSSWKYSEAAEAELTSKQIAYYDSDNRILYTPLEQQRIDGLLQTATAESEEQYINLLDDLGKGFICYFPDLLPVPLTTEDSGESGEAGEAGEPEEAEESGEAGETEDSGETEANGEDYNVIMCTAYGQAAIVGEPAVYTMHYGNQLAFKLLELGYTVLYKYIEPAGNTKIKVGYDASGNEDFQDRDYVFLETLEDPGFWSDLKDKATYDFRYILSGMLDYNSGVDTAIISYIAQSKDTADMFDKTDMTTQGRGDCIALIDIDRRLYEGCSQSEAILNITGAEGKTVDNVPISSGSKYAALFAPYVVYDITADAEYDYNTIFPGAFHYLACASKSLTRFREWYAISGYTRGISNLRIKGAGINFGEQAIQVLQSRYNTLKGAVAPASAINLIARIKGVYYLWGNRTAEPLTNDGLIASHFLNIRQLCTTIKKQLYVVCRQLTFDPNSDLLWNKLVDSVTPMLERMKNDQGIRDYRLYKIPTPEKATLQIRLHIVPIEAVEDFDINFFLEDSIENITLSIEEFGG